LISLPGGKFTGKIKILFLVKFIDKRRVKR